MTVNAISAGADDVSGGDDRDTRFLFTAEAAYPAFEEAVLSATDHVRAGFRVFDPETPLRSAAGRAIGHDWFDLIVHVLARGVRVTLTLSDFDPTARPGLHRTTWAAVRRLHAAGEASDRPDLLHLRIAMHPGRAGPLLRLLFWPMVRGRLRKETDRLNEMSVVDRRETLREMPGLASLLVERDGRIGPRSWPPADLVPASHHQKIAVIDDRVVYLGGLDLSPRRFDTPRHDRPADETWHDVQVLVSDRDVAKDAIRHLDSFLDVVLARRGAERGGALLRTLSRQRHWNLARMSPHTVTDELARAHYDAIAEARGLIYLETQFFRDRMLADRLARAAQDDPTLTLLLVVPAAPEDVAFEGNEAADARYGEYLQARCMDRVRASFGERVFVVAPAQRRTEPTGGRGSLHGAPIIYLHAKVSIFGEASAIVGSANLNGRSFRWDTEVGIPFTQTEEIRRLRDHCFRHWLPEDPGDVLLDPTRAVDSWRALAHENAGRPAEQRRGFVLPYPVKPARRFGRNLPGVPEEIV